MGGKTRTFKISTAISASSGYFYLHVRQIYDTLNSVHCQAIEAAQDKPAPGTTLEF
jgi:hypothetical protein